VTPRHHIKQFSSSSMQAAEQQQSSASVETAIVRQSLKSANWNSNINNRLAANRL
jgi:hypothetical protein